MAIIIGNARIKNHTLPITMDSWDSIFKEKGKVFTTPHPDINEVVNFLKQKDSPRILDLGCGTGRHLVHFASEGFQVYGLDSAPEGIKIARKWLEEQNLNANLVIHRMEEGFPYQDSFFDAIISIQAMHHNTLEKVEFIVQEIERVIKPGGLIFITVPKFDLFNKKNPWELKEIEKGTYIPLSGPEKGLFHHYFTILEIYDVFDGFEIKKIYIDKTKHRAIFGFRKSKEM